ncbi:MAG: hypothetical protein QW487_02225 [Candidatus Bathyarchaeia archaeon]|nr:hypothetical protein [Candidatus Bathyarchaeota archaeon]
MYKASSNSCDVGWMKKEEIFDNLNPTPCIKLYIKTYSPNNGCFPKNFKKLFDLAYIILKAKKHGLNYKFTLNKHLYADLYEIVKQSKIHFLSPAQKTVGYHMEIKREITERMKQNIIYAIKEF